MLFYEILVTPGKVARLVIGCSHVKLSHRSSISLRPVLCLHHHSTTPSTHHNPFSSIYTRACWHIFKSKSLVFCCNTKLFKALLCLFLVIFRNNQEFTLVIEFETFWTQKCIILFLKCIVYYILGYPQKGFWEVAGRNISAPGFFNNPFEIRRVTMILLNELLSSQRYYKVNL